MSGRKALTESELETVLATARLCRSRDRALLLLGLNTGFRVHELLSLKVGEVWNGLGVRPTISVPRRRLKGGRSARRRSLSSRTVPLNRTAITALTELLGADLSLDPDQPIFASRKGSGAISPGQANRIVQRIFTAAGIEGALGTHTLRKTFCTRVYQKSGCDIILTKVAMGHAHVSTTERYLAASDESAASVIRNLDSDAQPNFADKEHSA